MQSVSGVKLGRNHCTHDLEGKILVNGVSVLLHFNVLSMFWMANRWILPYSPMFSLANVLPILSHHYLAIKYIRHLMIWLLEKLKVYRVCYCQGVL